MDLQIQVPVEDMREPGAHDVTDPAVGGQGTAGGRRRPHRRRSWATTESGTRRSIWPAIYPELLELVRQHRSTIVFVNSRRGAERLALRLNELAARTGRRSAALAIARAHHGSLAREERLVVEDLLKSGELPCLVATSSLELGIDMGAVDLVLQVESPKSVTAGLQRIGRAGHNVGDVSKGRIFPKFRADLLECAVVARRMRDGEIETTVVPRNPLDVLAQQIVAMVATGRGLAACPSCTTLVRRAYPFAELSRELLDQVLDMLDGRYPSEEFAELRPRIVWDRVEDTIRARKGALAAGGDQRRHDPRPRPLRRAPARRPARGRAGRGDGLRGAAGADVPARRVDLADRGDHPRPRDRDPRPRRAGRGAVLARRRHRAARGAGPAIGEFSRTAIDREPAELVADYDLDERAATQPARPTCASSARPPAWCPATARSWSSASATRSATGGCACSRPSAGACTPPGASP